MLPFNRMHCVTKTLIFCIQFKDGALVRTGKPALLVTEKSATSTGLTAVSDETNISFDTDHTGLLKYESRSSTCYRISSGKLQAMVKEAIVEEPARFAKDCR